MIDDESGPPLGRFLAMLSAFGSPESPPRDTPGGLPPGRGDPPRAPAEGPPLGAPLRPDERELFRLLEEIAGGGRFAPEAPRAWGSFGRYTILGEIARGGSAVIYLATDPDRAGPVALKVARPEVRDDPDRRRRFDLEGRINALFDHPNIVPIHEWGQADGLPYLAMAYIESVTMADWILDDPRPAPHQAARLVREIAGAVGHAHDRGVLNLDLKPRNILLRPATPAGPDGLGVDPLVVDFGLARRLDGSDEATAGRALVGTPPYMAPEQIRDGPQGCGPPADVHALGVILYELLLGRPPFVGENPFLTIRAVVADEPAPPRGERPGVPTELEEICLKCLEKAPERRYPTGGELHDRLGRFLDGVRAPTRSPAP